MKAVSLLGFLVCLAVAAGCSLFDDDNGGGNPPTSSACEYCRDRDDADEVRLLLLNQAATNNLTVIVQGPGNFECDMYYCTPECPTPASGCPASQADPTSCADEVCGDDRYGDGTRVFGIDPGGGQAIVPAEPGDLIRIFVAGDLTAEATCTVAADVFTNWSGQAVATLVGQGQLTCSEGFEP